MEKFIRYSLITAFLLLIVSCKTIQPSTKENPDQFFKISLYSVGTGIDKEAEAVVINTINKYKKKGYDFEYTMNHWGREGEKNYCIFGPKLTADQYNQILDEIKSLLKDRQAHIYEKQACPEY